MRIIQLMCLAIGLVACQSPTTESASSSEASAVLGITTAVPSQELAREMELEFQVRQQGRLVESVHQKSAAHEAGIESGDVVVQLGNVTLYSQDDIDDFVSVHEPGDDVRATVVRRNSHTREELLVTLSAGAARAPGGIDWQFASLAQLPAALELARAEKKKVLVGLSGAET